MEVKKAHLGQRSTYFFGFPDILATHSRDFSHELVTTYVK
jgi:hypothetical protein